MAAIQEVYDDVEYNTTSLVYTWRIDNFSLYSRFPKEKIYSSNFMIMDALFRLCISRPHVNNNENNALLVTLSKVKKDGRRRCVKYGISLVYQSANGVLTQEDEKWFSDEERSGQQLLFCLSDAPSNDLSTEQFNDLLIIRCEVAILLKKELDNDNDNGDVTDPVETSEASKFKIQNKRNEIFPDFGYVYVPRLLVAYLLFSFLLLMLLADFDPKCRVVEVEANDYILNSTQKIISIAETLNLTELKRNSVDFLATFKEKLLS